MNRQFLFLLLVSSFFACHSKANQLPDETFTLHSKAVNDDYVISIKKGRGFDERKNYTLVFIADGAIGLGHYILGTDSNWSASIPANCIVVSFGHTGSWEEKRRRDFIPSDAGGDSSETFGQAAKFYEFLSKELVPFVTNKFNKAEKKVLIGHSFSGLFCLYASLKNDGLFNSYFAISPSVWANDRELLKIENNFSQANKDLHADIHIYAGGLEIFNRVLNTSRDFYHQIDERKYAHLSVSMEVIGGANHFSIRKPAIDRILLSLAN